MGLGKNTKSLIKEVSNELTVILDQLPVKVIVSDYEGMVLYANNFIREQLNLTNEKILGKPIWILNRDPEAGKKIFFERISNLKESEVYSYHAEANLRPDKSKWLDINVRPLKISGLDDVIIWVASDIDFIKLMEKDLARSNARYQAIFETATEGIFIADKRWTIRNTNPALEKMFGYKSNELIGKKVSKLIPCLEDILNKLRQDHQNDTDIKKSFFGLRRQFQGQKRNEFFFPIELNVNEVQLTEESFYTGLIKDISLSRELEKQVLAIAESERFKIGQELHDGVGQMLSAINLMIKTLSRKLRSNELPGADELDEITDMVKEADEEVRQLSHGFAHIELEKEGLPVALKRMCERFRNFTKTDCQFICSSKLNVKDRMTSLHLFRIVQEAVKNAIKHGKANKILVKLQSGEEFIILSIEDNGIGLFEEPNDHKFKGMGLKTMRYRAELLGGNFEIGKNVKGWTQVKCSIPLNGNEKNTVQNHV